MISRMPTAADWHSRGSYFTWAPPGEDAPPVEVFHVELGDPGAPVVMLVHGFPTCSIDWREVAERLSDRYRVCAVDFPGYGFSDKPLGWGYNLARDAALLDHYLVDVVGAASAVVVAHDRGSSVAILHALNSIGGDARTGVEHLVLTNGNVYLPLSNLTDFQRLVLDPATAPAVLDLMTPAMLAQGMGATTMSPPRLPDHADVEALTETFAHADGTKVLHETIQYLVERGENERGWLERLAATDLPTTVIWGTNDTIAPLRVATYVWHEFLAQKTGRNSFYVVPGANHYLQNDRPDAVVAALLHALNADSTTPGPIDAAVDSPLLVDVSRAQLPTAAEVLRPPGR